MTSRTISKFQALSLAVLPLLALATGCGSSEPQNSVAAASAGGAVSGPPTNSTSCSGGAYVTISGLKVCKTTTYAIGSAYGGAYGLTYSGYNWFPRLSPSDPSGYLAYSTGTDLKANDTVVITHSGSWGGLDVDDESYLGGFIHVTTSSWDCSKVSTRGYDGSALVTNEGVAAGMLVSDGTETYVPSSTGKVTIRNPGSLRFGLNVPNTSYNLCAQFSVSLLKRIRCEDGSGNTYVCPNQ